MSKQNAPFARSILVILAFALIVLPSSALAQKREQRHRTNAYILAGAAALLAHQHDLLTPVALGGAAYETWRMQEDIKNRHRRDRYYGYYYPSYGRGNNWGRSYRHDHGNHYGWYKHGRGRGRGEDEGEGGDD